MNDEVDELCTICEGGPVESDNGLSSDDGHDVDTTIEFQWIV